MQHKYVVDPWGARGRGEASNFVIGGSCHKYHFCRDKSSVAATRVFRDKQVFFLAKTRLLFRQKYACRDKRIFVATKPLSRQIFVAINIILFTKLLSRQAYFCRDKHVFVATKHLSRPK